MPAASVILANIIGTGVFVKARVMTCNVGSPEMVLTVWLVAGLLTLAGALVYAELGAMLPRSGGELHFIGAAFGRRWAFLYGWTKTVALGASVAAAAIIMVVFLNDLTGGKLPPLACSSSCRLLIIGSAAASISRACDPAGITATVLTAVKIALVLLVGLGALPAGRRSVGQLCDERRSGHLRRRPRQCAARHPGLRGRHARRALGLQRLGRNRGAGR